MHLVSPWTPRLADMPGQVHERLAAALVEDILSCALTVGDRLPAHRDLAVTLGLSVGTVTRAYATLQRRGLARAERGRGMFVTATGHRGRGRIDLSLNTPPPMVTSAMLSDMLSRIGTRIDPHIFTTYVPPAGRYEHRLQLARKVTDGRDLPVEPERLMITNGAQHAIFVALAAAPAGPVAIERFTYPGALRAARGSGRAILPVDLDGEGIVPEALEVALDRPNPPRVLYLVPTLQTPTGATMGEARRHRIAAIARARDLLVIEDDVYSVFAPRTLPPIARLAPERTLYVGSLSKSLAPGLRIGYLVAPPGLVERCNEALTATASAANPISCLLMEHCLTEGLSRPVSQSVQAEGARRNRLARAILADRAAPADREALHLWLPMKAARARDIVRRAAAADIVLAPPDAFMADPAGEAAGLRVCLGNASDEELERALTALARILDEEVAAPLEEPVLV